MSPDSIGPRIAKIAGELVLGVCYVGQGVSRFVLAGSIEKNTGGLHELPETVLQFGLC